LTGGVGAVDQYVKFGCCVSNHVARLRRHCSAVYSTFPVSNAFGHGNFPTEMQMLFLLAQRL